MYGGNSSLLECEIPRRLERGTKHSLRGCGNLSLIVRLTVIRNELKRTISTSGELGLLQMVLELVSARTLSPLWGVDCEIPHRLERITKHSL